MEEANKKIVKAQDVVSDNKIMVVKELPTQPVRSFVQDGIEYNLITIEEALSELLNR